MGAFFCPALSGRFVIPPSLVYKPSTLRAGEGGLARRRPGPGAVNRKALKGNPMKIVLSVVLAAATLVLGAGQGFAYVGLCCAKCGGNMPMNIPGGGIPETRELRIKVSPMYMRMDGLRDGTSTVAPGDILGMPAAGKFMAVPTAMDMKMLNLAVGFSFSDRFFGGLMFMYQEKDMDMRFNSGMATMTGMSGFAMRSRGLADTMLMTKYRLMANDPLVPTRQASLMMGLNIPTGSIDKRNSNHPVAMRQTELLPYGMQLGSGTFDPILGLLYQASSSPWWWGANLTGTFRLYDNQRDYHLGNRFALDLYGMHQVRYDFLLHLQLNGAIQEDIRGEADEAAIGLSGHSTKNDPASTVMTPLWLTDAYGGTKVFVSAGFQWQPVHLQIVDLTLQVPVHQDLNGPQLEEDYRVMLTWYKEIPTKGSIRHPQGPKESGASRLGF